LPALAAAAARDAQRQRQADSAPPPVEKPAPAGLAPAGLVAALASNAGSIAAQTGTVASEQMQFAARARAAIPEGLRDFVDSADHARMLVLAVLASKVPEVEAGQ